MVVFITSTFYSLPCVHVASVVTIYIFSRHTPQCNRSSSLKAFHDDVFSGPDRIALLGCGCSVATEPVAETSHYWNISQVSVT